jgi:hypothetical protein
MATSLWCAWDIGESKGHLESCAAALRRAVCSRLAQTVTQASDIGWTRCILARPSVAGEGHSSKTYAFGGRCYSSWTCSAYPCDAPTVCTSKAWLGWLAQAEIPAGGNAAKSGEVSVGDQLIATSGFTYTTQQKYQDNWVKGGEGGLCYVPLSLSSLTGLPCSCYSTSIKFVAWPPGELLVELF